MKTVHESLSVLTSLDLATAPTYYRIMDDVCAHTLADFDQEFVGFRFSFASLYFRMYFMTQSMYISIRRAPADALKAAIATFSDTSF